MDDATSAVYSGILVEEEGTASSFQGLLETFTAHGLPGSLYTDRGSHYFFTPEAGGKVDKTRPTQSLPLRRQGSAGRSTASASSTSRPRVKVHAYPDATLAVFHGPRLLARYDRDGALTGSRDVKAAA